MITDTELKLSYNKDNFIFSTIPIASGDIPDGFFGDYCNIDFRFHQESGKTIALHKKGYFTFYIPPAQDIKEAIWLLSHHPSAKTRIRNLEIIQEV